jgi:2'-5' RNA ligase
LTEAASVSDHPSLLRLRLPDETVDTLVEWQALLQERRSLPARRFRPVAPDNLHVTLAFRAPSAARRRADRR